MLHRMVFSSALLAVVVTCPVLLGGTDEQAKFGDDSAANLSLEVQALRTLRALEVTNDQLKMLRKMAGDAAEPPRDREAQATDEYRDALRDLRNAYVDGTDDDRIDELEEQLEEIADNDENDVDDDVEITDAARRLAPQALRQLTAAQVASYIGKIADNISDPRDLLVQSLTAVRGLDPDEFDDERSSTADETARLLAGVDASRGNTFREKVLSLLDRARSLPDDAFKSQLPELEKSVGEIVGNHSPMEIIQHAVEHDLAELLSNPQLIAAIKARLAD